MKKLIFLLFIINNLYAIDFKCPQDSYKVQYFSKIYNITKYQCYKTHNGRDIKHGREIHVDKNNNIVLEKYYKFGKEALKEDNSTQPENNSFSEATNVISAILNSSRYRKDRSLEVRSFDNQGCIGKASDFMQLFLMNKPFKASYRFSEKCDIEGSWNPQMNKFFPVRFKLKDLKNFNKVSFKLKFTLNKLEKKLLFIIKDGLIEGNNTSLEFSAEYEGLIDLLKSMSQRRLLFVKQNGLANFSKFNGKMIKVTKEFNLN